MFPRCSLTLESLVLRHNDLTAGPAGEVDSLPSFFGSDANEYGVTQRQGRLIDVLFFWGPTKMMVLLLVSL